MIDTLAIHQHYAYCDCGHALCHVTETAPVECPACHAPTGDCPRCGGELLGYDGVRREQRVRNHRCMSCRYKQMVGVIDQRDKVQFHDTVTGSLRWALAQHYHTARLYHHNIDYIFGMGHASRWDNCNRIRFGAVKVTSTKRIDTARGVSGQWVMAITHLDDGRVFHTESFPNLAAMELSLIFEHGVRTDIGWRTPQL